MSVRPSGTVTFLFTDIEGSTRRWEAHPDAMRVALAAHDEWATGSGNSQRSLGALRRRLGPYIHSRS